MQPKARPEAPQPTQPECPGSSARGGGPRALWLGPPPRAGHGGGDKRSRRHRRRQPPGPNNGRERSCDYQRRKGRRLGLARVWRAWPTSSDAFLEGSGRSTGKGPINGPNTSGSTGKDPVDGPSTSRSTGKGRHPGTSNSTKGACKGAPQNGVAAAARQPACALLFLLPLVDGAPDTEAEETHLARCRSEHPRKRSRRSQWCRANQRCQTNQRCRTNQRSRMGQTMAFGIWTSAPIVEKISLCILLQNANAFPEVVIG